jgi:hypothetical protein
MKYFVFFVILAGLAFPVFAQNAALAQRLNALSDSMGSSITNATSTLQDFDVQIKDKKDMTIYTSYLNRYGYLVSALQESEGRFKLLIRTNDRNHNIEAERDTFEAFIKQLQAVKSDFDAYLKSPR